MKYLTLVIILSIVITGLFGQTLTKKEAAKSNIKSVSVWQTDMTDRKAKPVPESITRYDAAGNLTEITEHDKDGLITLHESYEYNENGFKTGEIQYWPDGKIQKKHVYKYTDGLRTERLTYDKNGKLIAQNKYVYEFHSK